MGSYPLNEGPALAGKDMYGTDQLSFVASDELRDALDIEAFQTDEPRSAVIRRILAEHLRETGALKRTDPTTRHQGQTNRHFRPRGGR